MASHTHYASYRHPVHTLSKGYGDPLLWISKQGEGKAEGEREEQKKEKEKEKSKREIAKKPCLKSGHGNARDMRPLAFERVTIRNIPTSSGDVA